MSNPEIFMSPLCREITVDGITNQIDIYRGKDDSDWILEVIDEENASIIWDEPFDTDQEALNTVLIVIEQEGCSECFRRERPSSPRNLPFPSQPCSFALQQNTPSMPNSLCICFQP